jgi:Na+-driven multidrug efflux pump
MSAASDEQTPERSGNRLGLLVAALVALESALLIVAAVALLVNAVTSDRGDPAAPIALAAIALFIGVGLAICVRGVLRGLRWTRGPVLTWQLLQAGVGMPLSTSGAWWAGAPLLAVSVVVGVLIAGRHVITETSDRF